MKTVLVTGACGGMGRATVKAFAEKGYRVFALDKKITDEMDGAQYFSASVTDYAELESVKEEIEKTTDTLDGIVHFAGIYDLNSLLEIDEEKFTRIFDINLFGVYRVNKIFSPMLRKGSRVIVTTSELAPLSPLPFTGLYAVTKGALEKYAESLRMELALLDVSVSILRPGAVNTGLLNVSTSALDRFCENTTLYPCNAENFKKVVDSVEAKNVPPEAVAKRALKAMEQKRPKYVYNLNRNPLLRLLNVLPRRWQVNIIKMIIREKKK